MTSFHDVRLPMRLALGAMGGPECPTEVLSLASGHEVRNAKWRQGRRRWDIGSSVGSRADLKMLTDFFEARSGRLHGFRFRDPLDHSSAPPGRLIRPVDQDIATGTGEARTFQLIKTLDDRQRTIFKPIEGTVRVALDGTEWTTGWTVDHRSGHVVFETAPPAGSVISAGFEYDCPVRFDQDRIETVLEAFAAGRVVSLSLVELTGPLA